MKIRKNNKIEKKQSGGAFIYTPFDPSLTVKPLATPADASSGSSGSSKKGDLDEVVKKMLSAVDTNGLPSDKAQLTEAAKNILSIAERTGYVSMSDYVTFQDMVNRVKYNKELYDDTASHLTRKGNWNEVALTSNGLMYVRNNQEDSLEQITPVEYYKNRDKYTALTNQEALYFRSEGVPFDSSILTSLSGSIGINDISEYVREIVTSLGTTSISGYTTKELAQYEETLMALMAGGPDGYYKFQKQFQIDDSTAHRAIEYLYNSLPSNMKQLLSATAAAEGQDPTKLGSQRLLIEILGFHTKDSVSVTYDSVASRAGGGSGSGGSGKTVDDTYLNRVTTASKMRPDVVQLIPNSDDPRDQGKLSVTAYRMGPIIDRLTDVIDHDNFSLNYLFSNAEFSKGADTSMTSLGGEVLKTSDFNKIMINNSSQIYNLILPYKQDDHGNIVPDLDKVDAYNEWYNYIKDNPGISQLEAIQLAHDKGLGGENVTIDPETNQITLRNVMSFLAVHGYVNDKQVKLSDKQKHWMHETSRREGRDIKQDYKNIVHYKTDTPSKNDKKVGSGGAPAGQFYEGLIMMPVTRPEMGAFLTMNTKIDNERASNAAEWYSAQEILSMLRERTDDNPGQFQ